MFCFCHFLFIETVIGFLLIHGVSTFVCGGQSMICKLEEPCTGTRQLINRYLSRTQFFCLSSVGNFNSQSNDPRIQLSYIPDESSNIRGLLDFLNEEECEGIDETCIGLSRVSGRRGLFAKASFQSGEYILAIPAVTAMEITVATEEFNEVEKGLLLLKKLTRRDGASASDFGLHNKWYRYLQCLPTRDDHFDATCDFWTESDLTELQIPSLIHESIEKNNHIHSVAITNNVNPDELHFATWLVRSRIFTRITSMSNRNGGVKASMHTDEDHSSNNNEQDFLHQNVLIPYLDMINHSFEGNAAISIIEGYTDEESMYCLQAAQDIREGDEILITYGTGTETTLELFMKYGFLSSSSSSEEFNENDCIHLDFSLLNPKWTTTIQQDLELLSTVTVDEASVNMRKAIILRAYLKNLQHWKNSLPDKSYNKTTCKIFGERGTP